MTTAFDTLLVYSQRNCPACSALKTRLSLLGEAYAEVLIDTDANAKSFLISRGHKTVPQMYRGGIHIPDFTK